MTRAAPPIERFLDKVDKDGAGGCWIWTAYTKKNGYGTFYAGRRDDGRKKVVHAHRFSYEQFVGPIPDGLDLDHLCRVRECVNPEHLEPVTRKVNLRRSPLVGKNSHPRSHCKRGHAMQGDNVYVSPRGQRKCRECSRMRDRRRGWDGVFAPVSGLG